MIFFRMIADIMAILLILSILSRAIGKKLISQMTFFDFAAGITIGTMAGITILDAGKSIWKGVLSLLVFGGITFIVNTTTLKSFKGREILIEEPILIMENGKILKERMKKAGLTMTDLLFLLRKKDIFYIDEIDYAFFETDGTVSVLKKTEKHPPKQVNDRRPLVFRGLPQTCILNGEILPEGLASINKDEKWFYEVLQQNDLKLEEISAAQIDRNMNIFVDVKEGGYQKKI